MSHGELYGFVEIGEIIFGERTAILVDPSEEKLKDASISPQAGRCLSAPTSRSTP